VCPRAEKGICSLFQISNCVTSKKDDVVGERYRISHKEELHGLQWSLSVGRAVKCRRLTWTGPVARRAQ
jgi:hypothetical protein